MFESTIHQQRSIEFRPNCFAPVGVFEDDALLLRLTARSRSVVCSADRENSDQIGVASMSLNGSEDWEWTPSSALSADADPWTQSGEREAEAFMFSETPVPANAGDPLRPILLTYLREGWAACCPGADGLTEDDILSCYPQAIAAGVVPDWQELCRRHAELTAEIQSVAALVHLASGSVWKTQ